MGLGVTFFHRGWERGIQLVSLSGSIPGAPQFGNLRGENPVTEDSLLHGHPGNGSRHHRPWDWDDLSPASWSVGQFSVQGTSAWQPERRGSGGRGSLLHAQGRGGEQGRTHGHSRRAWSPHFFRSPSCQPVDLLHTGQGAPQRWVGVREGGDVGGEEGRNPVN